MGLSLALYQPDIPQNVGTLLRLGACFGLAVHVIHPTGFPFSRAALRRSGMDYLDTVELYEHDGFGDFQIWQKQTGRRLVLLTTRSDRHHCDLQYNADDVLMVGRESAGVPDAVHSAVDLAVRIPMRQEARSLNVAISAALVIGEAMRQTDGFAQLS